MPAFIPNGMNAGLFYVLLRRVDGVGLAGRKEDLNHRLYGVGLNGCLVALLAPRGFVWREAGRHVKFKAIHDALEPFAVDVGELRKIIR